jgi:hypothetical protein
MIIEEIGEKRRQIILQLLKTCYKLSCGFVEILSHVFQINLNRLAAAVTVKFLTR